MTGGWRGLWGDAGGVAFWVVFCCVLELFFDKKQPCKTPKMARTTWVPNWRGPLGLQMGGHLLISLIAGPDKLARTTWVPNWRGRLGRETKFLRPQFLTQNGLPGKLARTTWVAAPGDLQGPVGCFALLVRNIWAQDHLGSCSTGEEHLGSGPSGFLEVVQADGKQGPSSGMSSPHTPQNKSSQLKQTRLWGTDASPTAVAIPGQGVQQGLGAHLNSIHCQA